MHKSKLLEPINHTRYKNQAFQQEKQDEKLTIQGLERQSGHSKYIYGNWLL
jgi:hypothetical protein